jgi:hypothetical protein
MPSFGSVNGRRRGDTGCRDRRWSDLYRQAGCIDDVVGNDASGQLDLAVLERGIGPRTKLIAITRAPTQGLQQSLRPLGILGDRENADAIGRLVSAGLQAVDLIGAKGGSSLGLHGASVEQTSLIE